ncbi:MAG: response regulator [Candidatus Cloacimonetes bacterium]|nr:response regulator [Candidatus Cloacimonadota bacterium]
MKYRILILEDNTDFRNNIMDFLSEDGIEVLGTGSIKEAMNIYNKNGSEINLFIIDLCLPYGNGMNFLKALRKNGNTAPAVIMSSIITEDVKRIGSQLGVITYLEKPFNLYELKRVVSKAIKGTSHFIACTDCKRGNEM